MNPATLMSKEAQEVFRTRGLHEIVSQMEKNASGRDTGEFTLGVAARLIGERVYEKRASMRNIHSGLCALRRIQKGMTNG